MSLKRIFVPFLFLVLAAAGGVSAQDSPDKSAQLREMKKLDFLVGQWKGEGWIQMGSQGRKEFTQTEFVQSKLGGLLLIIDGLGREKKSAGEEGEGRVVHEAFAVLSFDEQAGVYRFRAFQSEGRYVDAEARFEGDILQWGFPIPQRGFIRYRLWKTESGRWHETGEFSPDEKTWMKFLEMTLERVSGS